MKSSVIHKLKHLLMALIGGLFSSGILLVILNKPASTEAALQFVGWGLTAGFLILSFQKRLLRPWRYALVAAAILAVVLQVTLLYLYSPLAPEAHAASITVTTTTDTIDAGSGITCATITTGDLPNGDGVTSLREAICVANNLSGADIITFDPISATGTIALTIPGDNEDNAATGDLDITDVGDLTITGLGVATTTIDGGALDRVFHITGTNGVVNISDLTIQNGSSTGDGGGIFNASAATLNINNTVITNNVVTGPGEDGGGIANTGGGTVNIDNNTIIANNSTPDSGGGLFNSDPGSVMNISNSTISGNTADDQGGGVYNAQTLDITNATISGNSAITNGGGIAADFSSSVVSLDNVVVNSNSSGQDGGGIFNARGDMTIDNDSTISDNNTGRDGGGLANASGGTVNINNSTISGNTAPEPGEDGGGLANTGNGTVNVTNSTIIGNSANDSGGGIFNSGGSIASTVNINNTTISGNTANDQGGGVYSAQVTNLTNSTISGNTATNDGGGLALDFDTSTVTLNNVTIADNTATSGDGGGVFRGTASGVINVSNTIIADNIGSSPNCSGTLTSQGNNLIGDLTGCLGTGGSDLTNVDPLLGPLQLNAPGNTETHALLVGSPAVDAGNDATCSAADQRGVARVDQPGVGDDAGNICDIGAFEFTNIVQVPSLDISNDSVEEGDSGTKTMTFTVSLSGTVPYTVTVDVNTADDTATVADNDYVAASDTLTFNSSSTTQNVNVTINGDTKPEFDEIFEVNLSNSNWATISDGQGQGTIVNDDSAISINGTSDDEGDAGTTNFVFDVVLSPASDTNVTVDYNTADGTATTADNDYVGVSNDTVTFTPGITTRQITILVNGDTTLEPNETFFVNLKNPGGAAIIVGLGQGTIRNDDAGIYLPIVIKN